MGGNHFVFKSQLVLCPVNCLVVLALHFLICKKGVIILTYIDAASNDIWDSEALRVVLAVTC